jgi:hypothetical protein
MLSIFERKTAFSVIYKPKREQNRSFSYISGGLEGLFDFYDPLHHHPRTRHSPANSRHTKQFWSRPHGL